jgi:adenylate cyclase
MSGKIGDILLRLGYVKDSDIQKALEVQKAEGKNRRLGEILAEMFLTDEALRQALSLQESGFGLETGLDIVSHILKHRPEQRDIMQLLGELRTKGSDIFMTKITDVLDKTATFLEVSDRLVETLSLDELLGSMMSLVTSAVDADRGTLFLNDRETGELFSRIMTGGEVNEIRFPSHLGIAGSVFTLGQSVIIPDAYADPRFNKEVDKKTGYRTRNILCVPIRTREGDVIGVVQVLNKKEGDFTSDDRALLDAIASHASAALLNAQLFDEVKKAHEQEAQMLEVTSAISNELHLEPLLIKIMQTTTDILDADRSTLFMHDEKTDELWSVVAQGTESREIRIPSHVGIAGSVFTSGETINIPDAYADERFNKEVDKKTGYRTNTILCMPVVNKKEVRIGVIQVLNKKGGPFETVDENRLRAFSAQASIALENAKLFDEVLEMKNYNESILESLSNGVISLDSDNIIVKCNAAAFHILKADFEDLNNRSVDEVFKGGNSWVVESIGRMVESSKPDITMDAEVALDGDTPVSVNLTVVPLSNAAEERIGSMLVFEDITAEKRIRGTMTRYMTKEVVDRLIDGGESMLGGKISEATVLFSDIRSFTTLSEKLGASDTVSMLNDYFSVMVDILFKFSGVLDKYIGDAILAVFGAPFSTGQDEDNAVKSAVSMMQALREFNETRVSEGQGAIGIGIGINTDEVISGNIGSMKRMDYTVIGDGVNLASRLEGANKFYRSSILVSEFTFNKLKEPYHLRQADYLRVKGKLKPVSIYEVLDFHDESSFPHLEAVLELYNKGLGHYKRREWSDGSGMFERALVLNPNDGLSRLYSERCSHFAASPPDDDWDGVWEMKTK